jgi:cell division protein FtsB
MDKPPLDPMEQRKRIITSRNRVLALVLFGLVALFFAISIAKMS